MMTNDPLREIRTMYEDDAKAWMRELGWRQEGTVWVSPEGVMVVLARQRLGWPHNVVAHPLLCLCPPRIRQRAFDTLRRGGIVRHATDLEVQTWRELQDMAARLAAVGARDTLDAVQLEMI